MRKNWGNFCAALSVALFCFEFGFIAGETSVSQGTGAKEAPCGGCKLLFGWGLRHCGGRAHLHEGAMREWDSIKQRRCKLQQQKKRKPTTLQNIPYHQPVPFRGGYHLTTSVNRDPGQLQGEDPMVGQDLLSPPPTADFRASLTSRCTNSAVILLRN